jgi:hypothetical protein
MGQKAFGARCFDPNSVGRKPVCGRQQLQIVSERTCHCAETLQLWRVAWKGACCPNCLGPTSLGKAPERPCGRNCLGPSRPELVGAKAVLWQNPFFRLLWLEPVVLSLYTSAVLGSLQGCPQKGACGPNSLGPKLLARKPLCGRNL